MSNIVSLTKYLSRCGIGSRRKLIEYIKDGLISVDGTIEKELGTKISSDASVRFNKKILTPQKFVYLLLNKPKDYITTLKDQKDRKTVMDLVRTATDQRIYPVGRLDRNTTGLLLFTNDGELTQKLSHPRFGIKKIYQVTLNRPLAARDLEKIKGGLLLHDGAIKVDKITRLAKPNEVTIELHSGRYHIVRHIFAFLDYKVTKLDRTNYAGLSKKGLRSREWRLLKENEVNHLKKK